MREDMAFPGLLARTLAEGITWQFYKHWGQGVYAGEGQEIHQGDRSGCVRISESGLRSTDVPSVAQARLYESGKGYLSAVYSYPNGIGCVPHYFWEIYGDVLEESERFDTEAEMERRVIELLAVTDDTEPAREEGGPA